MSTGKMQKTVRPRCVPDSHPSGQSLLAMTVEHGYAYGLSRKNLDIPQVADSRPTSAFFRLRLPHTALAEIQASWADTRAGHA